MAMIDAEEARQACSKALVRILNGRHEEAAVIVSEFAQKCGRLVEAEKMDGEQGGLGDLDLSTLKVDLRQDAQEGKRPRE